MGATIRVVVTASNAGSAEAKTSDPTELVMDVLPSNTALPEITGTSEEGQTLSASTGEWEGEPPITYGYQWQACDGLGESCLDIASATGSSYTIGAGEIGDLLRVVVTATNSGGSASATSETSGSVTEVPPSEITVPVISGSATEGAILSSSLGTWAGTTPLTYSYQWQSCDASGEKCVDIEGANSSTYKLESASVGHALRVAVTASNEEGAATSVSGASATVGTPISLPAQLSALEISGASEVGGTLTADPGTWTGTPPLSYSYRWEICNGKGESCASVSGADKASYQPVEGDLGSTLRVLVTVSNTDGHASALSRASAVVEAPVAAESPCTDTWTGPAEGEWRIAKDWSLEAVPTASDVACIGPETDVKFGLTTAQVDAIHDEGTFSMYGGSLEITSTTRSIGDRYAQSPR